ncbi:MAG: hypothetical protein HGA44_11315 [Cellulomonadaceae bacterium]|nr:hypothetical protein [Cellulomonadaceae bacterium]
MTTPTSSEGAGRERLVAQVERMQGVFAALRAMDERDSARDQHRDDQRAAAARSGSLGPDWRKVQGRIDLGETTLHDVFSGADTSSAAVRLREASAARLARLRDDQALRDALGADEDTPDDPFAELERLRERVAQRSGELRFRSTGKES